MCKETDTLIRRKTIKSKYYRAVKERTSDRVCTIGIFNENDDLILNWNGEHCDEIVNLGELLKEIAVTDCSVPTKK